MNKKGLLKQRMACLVLILIGIVSNIVSNGDVTFLIFISMLALPGLFSKDRMFDFYDESEDEFES